jgi:hypothetical protein
MRHTKAYMTRAIVESLCFPVRRLIGAFEGLGIKVDEAVDKTGRPAPASAEPSVELAGRCAGMYAARTGLHEDLRGMFVTSSRSWNDRRQRDD